MEVYSCVGGLRLWDSTPPASYPLVYSVNNYRQVGMAGCRWSFSIASMLEGCRVPFGVGVVLKLE